MKARILGFLLILLLGTLTLGWEMSLAPGLSAKNALFYLIVCLWLIEAAVARNHSLDAPTVLVPFIVFVAYGMMSWFIAAFVIQPDYYDMIDTGVTLKMRLVDPLVVFLIFFYGVSTAKDSLALIKLLVWIVVLSNLITVVDALNIPDLGIIDQREDGRVGGPMGESNQYAAFVAFLLPATVALVFDSTGLKRAFAIAGVLITLLALLLAASRGAMVGLVAGGMFTVWFLRSTISMQKVATVTAITFAAILLVIIILFSTGYLGLLEDRFIQDNRGGAYAMTSARSEIWTFAVRRMLEEPWSFLIGFGWDSYDHMGGFSKATHNVYLNRIFNLGVIGLTLYLIILYNVIAFCRRAIQKTDGTIRLHLTVFVFGLAAVSVATFFVDLHTPWIYIWAYIGLITRLAVASLKESKSAEQPKAEPFAIDRVPQL